MRFSGNSETPYALHLFFLKKKCVTPFLERLSINGDSLNFGRLVEKIDDQRLTRANGVVPNYFVIET